MHIARKRFGQHFLCDQTIIQRIVSVLDPKLNEHLIEIGPGQGALTLPVLKRVKHLEAIELDRDLIPPLQDRCQRAGQLHIYSEDALRFDFASLKKDKRRLRIFGNLPYNISTPLLFHLIEYAPIISDMLFMLQKEVAYRLAAQVDTEHYGRLSVMTQYHCQVELLFDVPAQAFFPQPNVQSSMVGLMPHQVCRKLNNYALFADIVKNAFGQRRKTLRNSLKHYIPDSMWESIAIRSSSRAENLSVDDFVMLSNLCECK